MAKTEGGAVEMHTLQCMRPALGVGGGGKDGRGL